MKKIVIIEYGTGNLGSLLNSFESIELFPRVSSNAPEIGSADIVVLPGVGAAGKAMQAIRDSDLENALENRRLAGDPILGICLGAQIMGSFLEEGDCYGMRWFDWDVRSISSYPFYNNGWCRLDYDALDHLKLTRALKPTSSFFFNHRFVMGDATGSHCVKTQGELDIPAVYLKENLCAIQFHPEKSQSDGGTLLRNVLEDHYGL